ncbi:TPM domain-containing protein [Pedobacter sp. ASV17]|uniref:TPM domain-containing protein n=1 Tax=Pedobacter sp. TaxID=1411316 RepID=UPI0018EA8F29
MSIFTTKEQELIANAITEAEKATSGEIRIAVEKHCKGDAYERATVYFHELGMDQTSQHNGVLIYLATEDHKFAIIGDKGINNLVPPDFWETTKTAMKAHFMSNNLCDGIIAGIALAGEKLSTFFPHKNDDVNELPNEIVFIDQKP